MAQVYYQLIIQGNKTINDVPSRIRSEVVKLLEENGYSEFINPVD